MSSLSSGKLAHNTSFFDSYILSCETGIHSLLIFPVLWCVPLQGCNSVVLINAGECQRQFREKERKELLGTPYSPFKVT